MASVYAKVIEIKQTVQALTYVRAASFILPDD
jgi:hypothetical protein